ncbi:MAG TPA: accessory factor UbiK family protein [Methylotenera sp.]|nr:accessory factor UbiK family protein [Methylotenera sp.]
MLNPNTIGEISNKIKELINNSPVADLEKNVNALLKGAFTKMELVSREEFDIQAEVLRNTRQKLEELEAKLASLEAQMASEKESNKP